MADEIYCQIVRQCNGNPKTESLTKGLELLSLCCGLFLPCVTLFPYVIGFLQEAIGLFASNEGLMALARDCLDRIALQKIMPEAVFRRVPPSSQEICAVVTGGQMQQLVYLTDNKTKTIDIDSLTTIGDLIDALGEPKRFKGWSMFEVLNAPDLYMENPLKPDEMVCDVLCRWEKFQPPIKVEGELVFQFVWKKHIFLKSDNDEGNPLSLSMLYHQMVSSVVRGQIPSTDEEACYLAAVQLRHDFANAQEAQSQLRSHPEEYLPFHYIYAGNESLRNSRKSYGSTRAPTGSTIPADVVVNVMGMYQLDSLNKLTRSQLEKAYLAKVRTLPLFGCSLFNVNYAVQRKKLRPCLLALSESSIQIWEVGPGQKSPAKSLEYAEIASWGPKPGSLSIISGNLVNPTVDLMETPESFEIAEVIRAYKAAKAEAVLDSRRHYL